MTATLNAVVVPLAAALFGQWGALMLAAAVTMLAGCLLGIKALARKVRKRRADRAWAASAAWRMHVLDVQEQFRDREGLTLADFDAWADELHREEPAP